MAARVGPLPRSSTANRHGCAFRYAFKELSGRGLLVPERRPAALSVCYSMRGMRGTRGHAI
eukprot:10243131-Heterocapsa_arctica.AAC.1